MIPKSPKEITEASNVSTKTLSTIDKRTRFEGSKISTRSICFEDGFDRMCLLRKPYNAILRIPKMQLYK